MKFNFESFKKEKIKPYILPVLTLLSFSELKNYSSNNELIKETKNHTKEIFVDSSASKKDDKIYSALDFSSKDKTQEQQITSASPEEESLKKEINVLKEEISKVSDLKPIIQDNVFSIISQDDLSQKEIITKRLDNGLEVNSPLDMRHITNMVEYNILNEIKNIDLASTELHAFKEQKLLKDEGYVNENKPSQYVVPEFYFVLDKNQTKDSLDIIITIFSSKSNKIINKINLSEILPEGDEFTNLDFNSLVQTKIVPEIVEILKKEIFTKLKVNNKIVT